MVGKGPGPCLGSLVPNFVYLTAHPITENLTFGTSAVDDKDIAVNSDSVYSSKSLENIKLYTPPTRRGNSLINVM